MEVCMKRISILFLLITAMCFISCSDGVVSENVEPNKDYIDESKTLPEGCGVMLQAFTWESCKQGGTWWNTVASNSAEIKDRFEYVWFPPCTDSLADNGYMPKLLNNFTSSYGKESQLKAAIDSIKPAKAIADAVVNHRVGATSWGDFTNPDWGVEKGSNYQAICKSDEGFTKEPTLMGSVSDSMRGAEDTGDDYASARDLDHTNKIVQDGIIEWMGKLKDLGFVGYRYDYVRGFAGKYVGYYNEQTDAEFSVGELWPENYSPSGWGEKIDDWINFTTGEVNGVAGRKSKAFDFVLKGIMNSVFGRYSNTRNSNFGKLADEYILANHDPEYAVTFVDNHDTGSTQKHWPIDENDIGTAYVYILTHPGTPCVAWQHYFATGTTDSIGNSKVMGTNQTLQQHINYLISLRKSMGITNVSNVNVLEQSSSMYAAKIQGDSDDNYLIVAIGNGKYSAPSECVAIYSGTDFVIYAKSK